MVHIELVTGKQIKVQQSLYQLTNASGSVFRLTMVTKKIIRGTAGQGLVTEPREQEIFLHKDKIVYMYEV